MRRPVSPFSRWIVWVAAPPDVRQAILDDLDEEAAAREAAAGFEAARAWSRRQVRASVGPLVGQRTTAAVARVRRTQMSVWRGMRSDVSLAHRRLVHAPGFTLICLLTLALGIGGNTAVFTLIDRVLLKPLPVPRPTELYRLGDGYDCCVNSGLPGSFSLFSYEQYSRLRDVAPEFRHLAAFQANVRAITIGRAEGNTPAETMNSAFVSGNYFDTFEVVPAAGRLMQPADDMRGAPPIGVLSYRAWIRRFQRRPDIVGSTVMLNGVPATIVGVAAEGFYGEALRPNPAEIWVPLSSEPLLQPFARLLEARASRWLYIIGRLQPYAAIPPLQARLTADVQQWAGTLDLSADERKTVPQQHVAITPAAGGVSGMRNNVAPSLKLLQGVAVAVLLIACANLANLLLARGMTRRTETAVRVALGAPRSRLVAQFLVESVLLACAGGAAGLALSYAAARAIVSLTFRGATDIPVEAAPSLAVIGFAFVISLVTGIVFGVAPAVVGSRSDPIDAMRGARSTTERGSRVRQSLVALQVALSLVLITGAGLLTRSLQQLQTQDFGFHVEGRYVTNLAPSLGTIPRDQLESVYVRMQERVRRIPGVIDVGYSLYSPMSGDNWASLISVDGHATSEQLVSSWNRVSPRYFETVGTPVRRGRAFDERDRSDSPLVALVSEGFAKKFFGNADPIGKRLGFTNTRGTGPRVFEIVGVVGDAKFQDGWGAAYPTFYLPFLQEAPSTDSANTPARLDRSHYPQALEIHASTSSAGLEGEIRRALADVDRRITVRSVVPFEEQIAGQFNTERLISRLTLVFGGVALLLACLGLYGVTAYSVTRRTREIGIRMAIGATRPRVLLTILRGALGQLAAGVVIGVPAAFIAGRLLQARLFGVSTHDPVVLSAAVIMLALAALIAALIPAGRAAAMNPVRALRIE